MVLLCVWLQGGGVFGNEGRAWRWKAVRTAHDIRMGTVVYLCLWPSSCMLATVLYAVMASVARSNSVESPPASDYLHHAYILKKTV
mmetsp:Transcript_3807/g.8588  ORF Transcript_3807/g.8588 Transcript_3807/m.8588 type:complete len:86 (+) Transcript_3807:1063-1320(+)